MATMLPPLRVALRTTPLSWWEWCEIFIVSSTVFLFDEIRKIIRKIIIKKMKADTIVS